jgi:hypothetical protein
MSHTEPAARPQHPPCTLWIWTLAAGLSPLVSMTALAADLNFAIPVQVGDLHPDAKAVLVLCWPVDAGGNAIPSVKVGSGMSNEGTLNAAGVFSGTLSAGFDYFTKSDSAKAKGYRCDLLIKSKTGYHGAELGDGSNYWHVKQGTLTIQGPIP